MKELAIFFYRDTLMISVGIINGKQHSEIQQFLIKRFSDIEFYKRDGQFFIVKDLTDYDIDAIDTSEKYEVFENPEVEIIYGDSPVINEIIFKQNSVLDEDYKIVVKYYVKPTELIDGILEQIKSSKTIEEAYLKILELRKTLT